jgi:hypothetical protein
MATKKKTEETIDIVEIKSGRISCCVLGTTPLVLNRMSMKTMGSLLLPPRKKNMAERQSTLKHDPYAEFRASPYTDKRPDAATLLQHLSSAFKGSLMETGKDIPGASKAQVGRLTWVNGERIAIYGRPQIFCSVVRSADQNRTPDIRTRAIVPKWACYVDISFVMPVLNENTILKLFAAAGVIQGVGDGRPGKGKLTFGQFSLVSPDDKEFKRLVKNEGRAVQVDAMANPEPYDDETAEMLGWFDEEVERRNFNVERNTSVNKYAADGDDGAEDDDGYGADADSDDERAAAE